MADIFISCAREDLPRARQLAAALEAAGWTVYWDRHLHAGAEFGDTLAQERAAARHVLVLWSRSSVDSAWVQEEAREALDRAKLVPVLLEHVDAPPGLRNVQAADLTAWTGDPRDPALRALVSDLAHGEGRKRRPASAPARADPVAAGAGIVRRVWDLLRPRPRKKSAPPPAASEPAPVGAAPPEPEAAAAAAAVEPEPEPVLLGVSAPRRVAPGSAFSARFVAYVEALEERVRQQLKELGGDDAQSALGISPDRAARWKPGTPVTVRVDAGPHIRVRPTEVSFEWNGRSNLASFSLTVAHDIPATRTQICFEAFIEGLSVAFIPLDIAIGQTADAERTTGSARPPATAFASYSSLDAQNVALCLSALSRWDAGLKVFMDCLDLTPNQSWQQELERVIPQQDAFFLFWSANAAKSKWVDWEWHHAAAKKGLDAIRPFPLEDPAVAPPPPELQHLHFRDRYTMAREALARIAESRKERKGP
jgi:hypothetical protein